MTPRFPHVPGWGLRGNTNSTFAPSRILTSLTFGSRLVDYFVEEANNGHPLYCSLFASVKQVTKSEQWFILVISVTLHHWLQTYVGIRGGTQNFGTALATTKQFQIHACIKEYQCSYVSSTYLPNLQGIIFRNSASAYGFLIWKQGLSAIFRIFLWNTPDD